VYEEGFSHGIVDVRVYNGKPEPPERHLLQFVRQMVLGNAFERAVVERSFVRSCFSADMRVAPSGPTGEPDHDR
jgi:hypothetical protein